MDARPIIAAFALAISTAVAGPARAQRAAAPRTGSLALTVSVTDTAHAPVDGAEVVIPSLGLRGRTNVAGRLVFDSLPAGDYVVVARRFGFLPDSQRARLVGTIGALVFRLRPSAYRLDTALVESAALRDKMVDFERRRASGRGTYITRGDIERRNPIALADILRNVRGLSVRNTSGRTELRFVRASTRLDAGDCPPEMWIDGVRAFGATVDEVDPGEVEGIELYRGLGQIPAQYLSRTSACGLVIIWTRSPSRMPR